MPLYYIILYYLNIIITLYMLLLYWDNLRSCNRSIIFIWISSGSKLVYWSYTFCNGGLRRTRTNIDRSLVFARVNSHTSMRMASSLLSLFYKQRIQGSERLGNLPVVCSGAVGMAACPTNPRQLPNGLTLPSLESGLGRSTKPFRLSWCYPILLSMDH